MSDSLPRLKSLIARAKKRAWKLAQVPQPSQQTPVARPPQQLTPREIEERRQSLDRYVRQNLGRPLSQPWSKFPEMFADDSDARSQFEQMLEQHVLSPQHKQHILNRQMVPQASPSPSSPDEPNPQEQVYEDARRNFMFAVPDLVPDLIEGYMKRDRRADESAVAEAAWEQYEAALSGRSAGGVKDMRLDFFASNPDLLFDAQHPAVARVQKELLNPMGITFDQLEAGKKSGEFRTRVARVLQDYLYDSGATDASGRPLPDGLLSYFMSLMGGNGGQPDRRIIDFVSRKVSNGMRNWNKRNSNELGSVQMFEDEDGNRGFNERGVIDERLQQVQQGDVVDEFDRGDDEPVVEEDRPVEIDTDTNTVDVPDIVDVPQPPKPGEEPSAGAATDPVERRQLMTRETTSYVSKVTDLGRRFASLLWSVPPEEQTFSKKIDLGNGEEGDVRFVTADIYESLMNATDQKVKEIMRAFKAEPLQTKDINKKGFDHIGASMEKELGRDVDVYRLTDETGRAAIIIRVPRRRNNESAAAVPKASVDISQLAKDENVFLEQMRNIAETKRAILSRSRRGESPEFIAEALGLDPQYVAHSLQMPPELFNSFDMIRTPKAARQVREALSYRWTFFNTLDKDKVARKSNFLARLFNDLTSVDENGDPKYDRQARSDFADLIGVHKRIAMPPTEYKGKPSRGWVSSDVVRFIWNGLYGYDDEELAEKVPYAYQWIHWNEGGPDPTAERLMPFEGDKTGRLNEKQKAQLQKEIAKWHSKGMTPDEIALKTKADPRLIQDTLSLPPEELRALVPRRGRPRKQVEASIKRTAAAMVTQVFFERLSEMNRLFSLRQKLKTAGVDLTAINDRIMAFRTAAVLEIQGWATK